MHILDNLKHNLLDDDEYHSLVPVPIYYYIMQKMGVQLIFHVMISMGRFVADINLALQPYIHE